MTKTTSSSTSSFGYLKLSILVLVGLLSVTLRPVIQQWNYDHGIYYNIVIRLLPYIVKMDAIMNSIDDIEKQTSILQSITKGLEDGNTETMAKFYDKQLWETTFGPYKTIVTTLYVTSSIDNYKIPIFCTAPASTTSSTSTTTSYPLVLHFHGGGLILGSEKTEEFVIRWLANNVNVVVCSIGYRHAPKYPYPIPIQDNVDASIAILENKEINVAKELGTNYNISIDYTRVATWGMSAGGYMSAQTTRHLTQLGYNIMVQFSFIPMVKPHGGTYSMMKYWYTGTWTGIQNSYAWASYLRNDVDGSLVNNWKVNLLIDPPNDDDNEEQGKKSTLERLPPAYVTIHTMDTIHDEGEM